MSYGKWVVIAVVLFIVGLVLGLVSPASFAAVLSREIAELQKLGQSLTPSTPSTFVYIFARNAVVLLASFAFSPILCLAPILALTLNGLLLSFVSASVAHEYSITFVLAGLLPHGIFEIPALIIGQAAALSFGSAAMAAVFGRSKGKFAPSLKQNIKYLLIALGLLLPAAAMETYVTPLLVR